MLSLKTFHGLPTIHPSLSSFKPRHSISFLPGPAASSSFPSTLSSLNMPLVTTVEHVVLFKVRDSTVPSKIDAMIANLRSLISLDIASYLTAGPLLRRLSAAADGFGFTHLLHSRYRSKTDLATYANHPSHKAVVMENVIPICDDILAVDWIADVDVDVSPLPGSLVRLTLAKPRDGTSGVEVVRAIDGVRSFVPDSLVQLSYGENFSPSRAKGYDVGFISVFSGVDEVDSVEVNEEMEKKKEEKLRPLVESAIVVDYLVPPPSSSFDGTT